MITLADLFHDAATFLALEPEDVAAVLMEAAQQRRAAPQSETGWPIFWGPALPYASMGTVYSPAWPGQTEQAVTFAHAEALGWLRREGLVMDGLMSTPGGPGKLVFTRRGLQLRTRTDIARYREASALPVALVHPSIVGRVIPLFISGDRDTAVLCAFRAVEIAVREAAGPEAVTLFGLDLLNKAFNKTTGLLTDQTLVEAEREAERSLFTGAFGHGRNPVNHRDLNMDPVEAARLILLASHLLSIVEKRLAARSGAGDEMDLP